MDCKNVRSMGFPQGSLQTTYFLDTYLDESPCINMTLPPPFFWGGKSNFYAKSYGSSLEGFSPQREFMKFWVAVIYCNDPLVEHPACEWVLVGYEPFRIFGLDGRVLISPVGSGWIKGDRISGYFTPRKLPSEYRNTPFILRWNSWWSNLSIISYIGKMVVPPWNGGTLAV